MSAVIASIVQISVCEGEGGCGRGVCGRGMGGVGGYGCVQGVFV